MNEITSFDTLYKYQAKEVIDHGKQKQLKPIGGTWC